MDDLFIPLSDEEYDFLEAFLQGRVTAGQDNEGDDPGILNVSGLDGLLTAVVSGPAVIPVNDWLPVVWGDYPPSWQGEEEYVGVLSLLIRQLNDVAYFLMELPDEFDPIFLEREVEGSKYVVVDDWCDGYLRGVELDGHWDEGGREVQALLAPILAFTRAAGWSGHEGTDEEVVARQQGIADRARELHDYWEQQRESAAPSANKPRRRESPVVGRDDPCPCGSGRKYKHCCLH